MILSVQGRVQENCLSETGRGSTSFITSGTAQTTAAERAFATPTTYQLVVPAAAVEGPEESSGGHGGGVDPNPQPLRGLVRRAHPVVMSVQA